MIDLPYKKTFEELPDIDPEQFVEYFNLEFGLSSEGPEKERFVASDFLYIGVQDVNGIETMIWSVKGKDIYATVQPYEDSYLIAMDQLPSHRDDS
ncbi:MAG: hypothetical protein ABJ308_15730 [Halieaceae bacterium]